MNLVKPAVLTACISAGAAAQAGACDIEHSLRYAISGQGEHTLLLNGVLVDKGAYFNGFARLSKGLVAGVNEVSIAFKASDANSTAQYSVHRSCKGGLPDETPVAQITIEGTATKVLQFDTEVQDTAIYPGVKKTDGSGLLVAVQSLQDAVRNRDSDAVFALHGPLLANLVANGAPMERINAHVGGMIEEGELSIQDELTMTAVLDGQAWEVIGPKGEPPVSISRTHSDGTDGWSSGTLWIFVDGAWAILEP